ncbi:hypothetical protein ACFX14_035511 [Malus domestica]
MAVFGVSGSRGASLQNISVFSIRTFGHWDLRASVDLGFRELFRRVQLSCIGLECLFSLVIIMAGGRNGETVKG